MTTYNATTRSGAVRLGVDRLEDPAAESALVKSSVMLASGQIQACIGSQLQEFLELLEGRCATCGELPEEMRVSLAHKFHDRKARTKPESNAELVRAYANLFDDDAELESGTIRTDTFGRDLSNPWPDRVAEVLGLCGIDFFGEVKRLSDERYLESLKTYAGELVRYRNDVAHGDEPLAWTMGDFLVRLKWAIRMARHSDQLLEVRLDEISGRGWQQAV